MKLKINIPLKGHKKGSIINIPHVYNDDGEEIPRDIYWRKRLKDAEFDNCVEITYETKFKLETIVEKRNLKRKNEEYTEYLKEIEKKKKKEKKNDEEIVSDSTSEILVEPVVEEINNDSKKK